MSYNMRLIQERACYLGIALFNALFVFPPMRKYYRNLDRNEVTATHYTFLDISIDAEDAGRIDFELFGNEAPKTVNNFLGYCSGKLGVFDRYDGSKIYEIVPGKYFKTGDFIEQNGLGKTSVYDQNKTFKAEKNNLKFSEPYLLVAPANSRGETCQQFMVTFEPMPELNGSDHTIIGRVI